MENPTQFCLNEAIQQWRRELEISRAFARDDLDELEAHLRDAFTDITARGVAAPHAFRLATKQIGPASALAQEFAKADPQRQWLSRAIWTLAGLLLVKVPLYLGALGFIALLYPIADWTGRSDAGFMVASLGSLLIKALVVFGFWQFGRVSLQKLRAFAEMCARRPLVPILLSSILVVSLNPLFRWVHQAFITTAGTMPELGLPLVRSFSIWAYVLESLLWLALPFWLVRRQTLRQTGSNNPEAWLERCLWISIGVVLYSVSTPLLGPIGRIAHGLSAWVTSSVEWRTVAWAAGQWTVAGALVTMAVWILQSQPRFSQKVKRWIGEHAFFAFLGTALILCSLCWAFSMTATVMTSIPRLSGNAERFLHEVPNLAFIGALFWLVRQQVIQKPRHQPA